jgi:asparagine synthase (glutamine-hydrolysing)
VLREAFRNLVPESIRKRRKMGFGVPLGNWFRGRLRPVLEEELLSSGSPLFEHVNHAPVKALVDQHLSGQRDHGHKLFGLATLSIWLRSLMVR